MLLFAFSISSVLFLYLQSTFLFYYFDMSLSLHVFLPFSLSLSLKTCLLCRILMGLEEFGIKWPGYKHKPCCPIKLNTEGRVWCSTPVPLFLLNCHIYFQMKRLLMIMIRQAHSVNGIQWSAVLVHNSLCVSQPAPGGENCITPLFLSLRVFSTKKNNNNTQTNWNIFWNSKYCI